MLEVIAPGTLATLQDTGRRGVRALGIGTAGAMDVFSARVANSLLGNAEQAAVLELTTGALELRFDAAACIALCGADLDAVLDGDPLPLCAPVWIESRQTLRLRRPLTGMRAVLAVRGGFSAQAAFGSAATDLRAGFGGCEGRALKRGDRIAFAGEQQAPRLSRSVFTTLAHPHFRQLAPLGLIAGADFERLDVDDRARLLHGCTVSRVSDRMGLRLDQELHSARALPEQVSQAVVFGAVQLPPDGKAIILAADCQTTGGYPLAGVVAGVDHWQIAQARPGDVLRFRLVQLAEAQAAWRARERDLARLRAVAGTWWQEV